MRFCTEPSARVFPDVVTSFEKLMVASGIHLLKYRLEVSEEEQTRRLEGRIDDGRKIRKLSRMDLKSCSRWYDYPRARDEKSAKRDTAWAPPKTKVKPRSARSRVAAGSPTTRTSTFWRSTEVHPPHEKGPR